MADDDKQNAAASLPDDATTLLKKRARRRLIGAAALALFAAIVLPMVMDSQPAPPLRDIQVRIPSPDEGATSSTSGAGEVKPIQAPGKFIDKTEKQRPAAFSAEVKTSDVAALQPEAAKAGQPVVAEALSSASSASSAALPVKPAAPEQTKPDTLAAAALQADAGRPWEVQLGAYREAGRVKLLSSKLKELGVPVFIEKVDTPAGERTRVRAGPYATREAAEKARTRIKIVGVDGPVVQQK